MRVEGVCYDIEWSKFKPGMSLTFPCLDSDRAKREIKATTDRLGMEIVTKVVIISSIRALRVWRIR
jgi:hypothetical protein